jgi:hypothetical protein
VTSTQPQPAIDRDRLDLQHATERLWKIRHGLRNGVVDLFAAEVALRPLRAHPNVRVAWLASQTTERVVAAFSDRRASEYAT